MQTCNITTRTMRKYTQNIEDIMQIMLWTFQYINNNCFNSSDTCLQIINVYHTKIGQPSLVNCYQKKLLDTKVGNLGGQ